MAERGIGLHGEGVLLGAQAHADLGAVAGALAQAVAGAERRGLGVALVGGQRVRGVAGRGASMSRLPNPNRRRSGCSDVPPALDTSSMPLRSDASGGRSTVSITDVVEMSVGSEISCFWIDRLRVPVRLVLRKPAIEPAGAAALLGNAGTSGVEEAEIGGVELTEKGDGSGDGRPEAGPNAGLERVGGERGFEGNPSACPVAGCTKPGDGRGEGMPLGA